MDSWMLAILPLLAGWILDLLLGDPQWLPHPVVWFGKAISACEHNGCLIQSYGLVRPFLPVSTN